MSFSKNIQKSLRGLSESVGEIGFDKPFNEYTKDQALNVCRSVVMEYEHARLGDNYTNFELFSLLNHDQIMYKMWQAGCHSLPFNHKNKDYHELFKKARYITKEFGSELIYNNWSTKEIFGTTVQNIKSFENTNIKPRHDMSGLIMYMLNRKINNISPDQIQTVNENNEATLNFKRKTKNSVLIKPIWSIWKDINGEKSLENPIEQGDFFNNA